MAEPTTMTSSSTSGDHLCVLVHGLWGNPTHLDYICSALRARHPDLRLLVCKRNSGNFTYDGIETGGERVTKEIEIALNEFAKEGVEIAKLSVVGYSLGGLVARYAIGLLYSRGWFEKLQLVNFTTFGTPHLGVRTPLLGWHNHIWNVLGARVLSVSGRQLFLIDDFRHTGRPLLSILADKDSIFYKGLARFPHKTLYANIVNDKSTCFYTSAVSRIDPFADLTAISVNYVCGYEPVVVDPTDPVRPVENKAEELPPVAQRITKAMHSVAKRFPRILMYFLFVPIVIVGFLLNALFQTITSKRRIRLHQTKEGEREGYHYYRRLPLMLVEEMQEAVEGVIEDINQMQEAEHLPPGMTENTYFPKLRNVASAPSLRTGGANHGRLGEANSVPFGSPVQKFGISSKSVSNISPSIGSSIEAITPGMDLTSEDNGMAIGADGSCDQRNDTRKAYPRDQSDEEKQSGLQGQDEKDPLLLHLQAPFSYTSATSSISSPSTASPSPLATPPQYSEDSKAGRMEFPTLALAESQFEMIKNLEKLKFKKFPVWIHEDVHAHAAMIVRIPDKEALREGKVVIRHWLDQCFVA